MLHGRKDYSRCGIAGIRRFGPEPIRESQLRILMCALEHRGISASGIALVKGAEINVYKADVPAWEFVKSDGWRAFIGEYLTKDTEMALLHDRAATQGDPDKMENNHPVYSGVTAVTHNGMISNDFGLFNSLKLERKAEVDTDIIRALLDRDGLTRKGIESLNRMMGSAAIACASTKFPGKLLLARSGSPLVVASVGEQMIWASEKGAIHAASRPFFQRWGIHFQANRSDAGF